MYESTNASKNNVSSENQLDANKYVRIYTKENSVKKVLFVGNSITRHAPKSDIGWFGDWGMAASAKDKDYVHLVVDGLNEKYGNIDYCIAQAALWETNYFNGADILNEFYTPARDFNADIVIIRIGENINRDKNKEINSKPYFSEMVRFFAKDPKAKVIVTDNFWRIEVLNTMIREVADENGYKFCHISDLESNKETMAIGLFEHEGVSLHPGDYGMKCIAERILKKL